MNQIHVSGKKTLHGRISPSGNKNEALPAICACLLTNEPVVLRNVPRIIDVTNLITALASMGVAVSWLDEHSLRVHAQTVCVDRLDRECAAKLRGSFLLAAALLWRSQAFFLPVPGGDRIGMRSLHVHFSAFEACGVQVRYTKKGYRLSWQKLSCPGNIFLDEPSVMATENVIMLVSRFAGTTVIENAAAEPHVQGLCHLLCAMGCTIEGIGSNRLTVHGRESLSGAEHAIAMDHIEIGSFISLAVATGSCVEIRCDIPRNIRPIVRVFRRLGVSLSLQQGWLAVDVTDTPVIRAPQGMRLLKVDDGPWPKFPTDLMSALIVAATQCKGNVLFFEKMFESRLFFVDELIRMGACIVQCDPHRIITMGPACLSGAYISSPDIRAGYALLIAALAAEGISRISNMWVINRGYERPVAKLQALGADVAFQREDAFPSR